MPIGDETALATALAAVLDAPRDEARLRAAAARYEHESATSGYLQVFGLAERAEA